MIRFQASNGLVKAQPNAKAGDKASCWHNEDSFEGFGERWIGSRGEESEFDGD